MCSGKAKRIKIVYRIQAGIAIAVCKGGAAYAGTEGLPCGKTPWPRRPMRVEKERKVHAGIAKDTAKNVWKV